MRMKHQPSGSKESECSSSGTNVRSGSSACVSSESSFCLINKGIISATDHTIANYSVPLCTKATGADVGLVPSIGQNTPSRPYHYRLHYCDL